MTEQEHRELDAAVALEVMEWVGIQAMPTTGTLIGWPTEDAPGRVVPRYSSRIEDAWQVVERLRVEREAIEISMGGVTVAGADDPTTEVTIGLTGYGRDASSCVAICRAALEWARRREEGA